MSTLSESAAIDGQNEENDQPVQQDEEVRVQDDELVYGQSAKTMVANYDDAAPTLQYGFDVHGRPFEVSVVDLPRPPVGARDEVFTNEHAVVTPPRSQSLFGADRRGLDFDVEALSQAPKGELLAGKYRAERVIGESRIAINIRVRHAELGQRFLFIHLHRRVRGHIDAVERFLKGARGALRLQSEHTARTVDAGRLETGVPYVVSEYPTGSSLRSLLRIAGPVPVSDAVDYALQATESLAEAHLRGMAHGSLDAAHLYIGRRPDGTPLIKVLGFGIADALCAAPLDDENSFGMVDADEGDDDELSAEHSRCVAPEQIRDPSDIDAMTDVWAVGALLHELIAGAPVFVAASRSALVAMIAADAPTPITSIRADVPAGLESVILRCLAKERHARFPSISELAVALEPFAPPHARPAVNRVVRTLARSSQPPSLPSSSQALVRVGPAVPPSLPALPASSTSTPPSLPGPTSSVPVSRSVSSLTELAEDKPFVIPRRLLMGAGAAAALVVATLVGGAVARNGAPPVVAPAAAAANVSKPVPEPVTEAPAQSAAPAAASASMAAPSASAPVVSLGSAIPSAAPPAPVAPTTAAAPRVATASPPAKRTAAAPARQPAKKTASALFDDTE